MKKHLAAAVLAAAVLQAHCGVAYASWDATSAPASVVSAKAAVLSATGAPEVTVFHHAVTLQWSASTVGAAFATQYEVKRYDAAGTAAAMRPTCSWELPLTGCVEVGVPSGTWTYTVTPKLGKWLGPESAAATAVVAGPVRPFSFALPTDLIVETVPPVDVPASSAEVPEVPTTDPPVIDQPVVEQPVIDQPVVEQPVVEQPVVEQSSPPPPVVEVPPVVLPEIPVVVEPTAPPVEPAPSVEPTPPVELATPAEPSPEPTVPVDVPTAPADDEPALPGDDDTCPVVKAKAVRSEHAAETASEPANDACNNGVDADEATPNALPAKSRGKTPVA